MAKLTREEALSEYEIAVNQYDAQRRNPLIGERKARESAQAKIQALREDQKKKR